VILSQIVTVTISRFAKFSVPALFVIYLPVLLIR